MSLVTKKKRLTIVIMFLYILLYFLHFQKKSTAPPSTKSTAPPSTVSTAPPSTASTGGGSTFYYWGGQYSQVFTEKSAFFDRGNPMNFLQI